MRVFFYGLFMDEAVLTDLGVRPREAAVGFVEGFALRIGRRATLVPQPGAQAHGVSMTITDAEAADLYAEESVADYRPAPVSVTLKDGGAEDAVCYVLPQGPDGGTNADYASALLRVARRLGLPVSYCEEIERFGG